MRTIVVNWVGFEAEADTLAARWRDTPLDGVWGIPTGGCCVALHVAKQLGLPIVDAPVGNILVVDDLIDSGRTMRDYIDGPHDALFRKPHSPADIAPNALELDGWVQFPWEPQTGPEDAVVRLLEYVGENPARDGLLDTPKRVVKALTEMTEGYHVDISKLLEVRFDVAFDEMIVVRDVPFTALCEHHVLPFTGYATVGYIPSGGVVGLSKLARLVEAFARRLQVQERMTVEIADALVDNLNPIGAGVVVRAVHSCMTMRGIRKQAEMVTSNLRGAFLTEASARAEFLALADSKPYG